MRHREKIMAVVLLVAILVWQGGPFVWRAVVEPITVRQAELDGLNESIAAKQDEQVRLARAQKQWDDWQVRSLPPDPLDAQRLYQRWLTDLAQGAGFENLTVTPERRTSRNEIYTTVDVSVSGEARLEQLCVFLYRFYRTDLLHRVTNLNLQGKDNQSDPVLKVSLTAEGLALVDAAPGKRLFAQTTVAQTFSIADEVLIVADPLELAAERDFLVRVGGEYLDFVEFSGNKWTVRRGAEASTWAAHEVGEVVEIVPVNTDAQSRTLNAFRALITRNPFAVPVPEEEPAEADGVAEGPPQPSLDADEFTFLTGIISRGDQRKALLFDRLNNQRTVVAEGSPFSSAGGEVTVIRIGSDHIVLGRGDQQWRLDVGENLRAMQLVDEPEK